MQKILVLGGSGMLGSMVTDVLSGDPELKVTATVRSEKIQKLFGTQIPEVEWRLFDIVTAGEDILNRICEGNSWIVNAIGMTKPYTRDDNAGEIERAIRINAQFTYDLGHAAVAVGAQVLQIATDCVYDGVKGGYTESDPHNPIDVYGKTKSLGEALLPSVLCLRCSIIGPEPKAYAFLLEWFLRQPRNAAINGFVNHQWNGVTTLHFAKLCRAIIRDSISLPHLQHIIPKESISKYNLLKSFAASYDRGDLTIQPTEAKYVIDRTLKTDNETMNLKLWQAAGYHAPPSIPEMVAELASFSYRLEGV